MVGLCRVGHIYDTEHITLCPHGLSWQACERRAQAVLPGKESAAWVHITVEMTSDEERDRDSDIHHLIAPRNYTNEQANDKGKAGYACFSN